jgi:hypothetical protein
MEDVDIESKLITYATEFLRSYTDAIDTNFPGSLEQISELGMEATYFPLYERRLGEDTAIAVLFTSSDFYLFFLAEPDTMLATLEDADSDPDFSRDWTFNTPAEMRIRQARDVLGISTSSILRLSRNAECVNIPGTDFARNTRESMIHDAQSHGNIFGNQAGQWAEADLPGMLSESERKSKQASFSERYAALVASDLSTQTRGQEFEKLWREVLEFHGWHPKKIRIPGEENDFTAIYQGLHILGEVRWFKDDAPMDGGKMREFLGKLDPRPQTIGLFVSHSGLNDGAWSVVRRAVNSKTVVVFDRVDIEAVLVHYADLGETKGSLEKPTTTYSNKGNTLLWAAQVGFGIQQLVRPGWWPAQHRLVQDRDGASELRAWSRAQLSPGRVAIRRLSIAYGGLRPSAAATLRISALTASTSSSVRESIWIPILSRIDARRSIKLTASESDT